MIGPQEWDMAYPGLLDGLTLIPSTANVIMQMCLPSVGRGVLESRVKSGRLIDHPLKRTRLAGCLPCCHLPSGDSWGRWPFGIYVDV